MDIRDEDIDIRDNKDNGRKEYNKDDSSKRENSAAVANQEKESIATVFNSILAFLQTVVSKSKMCQPPPSCFMEYSAQGNGYGMV